MMNLNASTLESSLFLIEYCNENSISKDEIIKSKWSSNYMFDNDEILSFCIEMDWLVDNDGLVYCTNSSLNILGYEDQFLRLRYMLNNILDEKEVYWKGVLSKGREVSKMFLTQNNIQILEWCGLFKDDDEVSDWWLNRRTYYDEEDNEKKSLIGRLGERKTIAFEENRVGNKPKWTALELGDSEGYDVLSWENNLAGSERLRIEVKASIQDIKKASFYVTRNEWEKAISGGNHVFHLWPQVEGKQNKPIILSIGELFPHIPKDPGDGKWREAKIPMNTFQK